MPDLDYRAHGPPAYMESSARGDYDPYGAGRYRALNPALEPRAPMVRGGGDTESKTVSDSPSLGQGLSVAPKSSAFATGRNAAFGTDGAYQ